MLIAIQDAQFGSCIGCIRRYEHNSAHHRHNLYDPFEMRWCATVPGETGSQNYIACHRSCIHCVDRILCDSLLCICELCPHSAELQNTRTSKRKKKKKKISTGGARHETNPNGIQFWFLVVIIIFLSSGGEITNQYDIRII